MILRLSLIGILLAGITGSTLKDNSDIDYMALYAQGQSYDVFLDEAVSRREMWLRNTDKSGVSDSLQHRIDHIQGSWKLLAVAVDACSDSANIIPYLAKLASSSNHLDLRIIDSDMGREIMEANRTPDGRASTPTIVVLNDEYEPVGFLIERPAELRDWAIANKPNISQKEFMKKKFEWYDADLGNDSMSEIVTIIEEASL